MNSLGGGINEKLFDPRLARRAFLLLGAALVAGCATAPARDAELPDAEFPGGRYDDIPSPRTITRRPPVKTGGASNASASSSSEVLPGGFIPRARWAKSGPDAGDINPMLPVKSITIHHEGWDPFTADDFGETASRIEHVRIAHRNAKGGGYADIGYHFVIDREGRVWEGRSLKYQGAHVKKHNEGNVGIMCLGNFEEQTPTPKQLAGLSKQVKVMMVRYNVPIRRVYTHQEWQGAQTLCPGRTLQTWVNRKRPTAFA
ncbi:MAG: peptidoglycan recognition family protein [Phycisphaerae bacterium]|nr:peptidoglycan recognition family protein [Phycisphaerae bacterium]